MAAGLARYLGFVHFIHVDAVCDNAIVRIARIKGS
jgi:hypothetical protein